MIADVTVTLNNYPTKTLHNALVRPITADGQSLALLNTRDAGGEGIATAARIYVGVLDVTMPELETFFRGIPAGSYGTTQGIVIINDYAAPDLAVNRIGFRA